MISQQMVLLKNRVNTIKQVINSLKSENNILKKGLEESQTRINHLQDEIQLLKNELKKKESSSVVNTQTTPTHIEEVPSFYSTFTTDPQDRLSSPIENTPIDQFSTIDDFSPSKNQEYDPFFENLEDLTSPYENEEPPITIPLELESSPLSEAQAVTQTEEKPSSSYSELDLFY